MIQYDWYPYEKRRDTETQTVREKATVMMEAETGVMYLHARE